MKRTFIFLLVFLQSLLPLNAVLLREPDCPEVSFEAHFTGSTLRLDYVLCGDATHQAIYWRQAFKGGPWAGRRSHLSAPLLKGNGQIRILDPQTGECLYVNSFSTLFQEWTVTEEATKVQKAFEGSFLLPFPRKPIEVEVVLTDTHGKVSAYLRHAVHPEDILIRPLPGAAFTQRTVHQGGDLPGAVDIAIVAEGYTPEEEEKFWADASRAAQALLSHEPFTTHRDQLTLRALFTPSQDSGVSIPREGTWKKTVVSGHFDTFYTERYLTTSSIWELYNLLGTTPFEQIIVLSNTPIYGGGGIFNSLTIMGSDHPTFSPVLVHEFGHAFGGLGDEYYYDDQFASQYPPDTEPWEPNLTTLKDFSAKWEDMMEVPGVGLHEGGGYTSKGVYRPAPDCRMKTNQCERFCPVCTRAIERMIEYLTR